jgi:hypothetical protein
MSPREVAASELPDTMNGSCRGGLCGEFPQWTMKWRCKALLFGLALAPFGFAAFFVLAHGVPAEKLRRISDGLTQSQVEEMVGSPESVRHEPDGSTTFFYGGIRRLRWCSVEIHFGTDGRVLGSVFHDH